jgi:hypothetical protein
MELFQALLENTDSQNEFVIETLEDEMKMDLLVVAFKKFTLDELEEKLGGNKFTI